MGVGLLLVAIIGFSGQVIAAAILGILNGRNSRTNRRIIESTHTIVNSERTAMFRMISLLAKRIAKENPGDKMAQEDAIKAENDYLTASRSN